MSHRGGTSAAPGWGEFVNPGRLSLKLPSSSPTAARRATLRTRGRRLTSAWRATHRARRPRAFSPSRARGSTPTSGRARVSCRAPRTRAAARSTWCTPPRRPRREVGVQRFARRGRRLAPSWRPLGVTSSETSAARPDHPRELAARLQRVPRQSGSAPGAHGQRLRALATPTERGRRRGGRSASSATRPSLSDRPRAAAIERAPSRYMEHFAMVSMKVARIESRGREPVLPLPQDQSVERHQGGRLVQASATDSRFPADRQCPTVVPVLRAQGVHS
jgi:hypothetical protein